MTKQPALKEARADVVSVLKEARALLVKDGWCQGAYERGKACCALGAIRKAAKITSDWHPATRALAAIVGYPAPAISVWNDDPCRTKKDVLAAFNSAIRSETARKGQPEQP